MSSTSPRDEQNLARPDSESANEGALDPTSEGGATARDTETTSASQVATAPCSDDVERDHSATPRTANLHRKRSARSHAYIADDSIPPQDYHRDAKISSRRTPRSDSLDPRFKSATAHEDALATTRDTGKAAAAQRGESSESKGSADEAGADPHSIAPPTWLLLEPRQPAGVDSATGPQGTKRLSPLSSISSTGCGSEPCSEGSRHGSTSTDSNDSMESIVNAVHRAEDLLHNMQTSTSELRGYSQILEDQKEGRSTDS